MEIPIVSVSELGRGRDEIKTRGRTSPKTSFPEKQRTFFDDDVARDVEAKVSIAKGDQFLEYLLTTDMTPSNHIPCFRKILTCQEDDNVPQVFRRLASEGFTSCPVMKGKEFVGFVDMLDLVKYTTNMFWGATEAEWEDFWSKERMFKSARIKDVMEQPRMFKTNPQPIVQENSTFHALEVLVRSKAHRLAVLDNYANRRLVGILTQSMMLSECTQRTHMLRNLKNRKVRDMIGVFSNCVTVNQSRKAINAFNIMAIQDITGVAVVDDDGVLVDSISVKDLRGVGDTGKRFSRLFLTCKEYKNKIRRDYPIAAPRAHYSARGTPSFGLYVTENDTFLDVLMKMDDGNIHRIFVCSEITGVPKPTHVITQTDMLKQIFKQYT